MGASAAAAITGCEGQLRVDLTRSLGDGPTSGSGAGCRHLPQLQRWSARHSQKLLGGGAGSSPAPTILAAGSLIERKRRGLAAHRRAVKEIRNRSQFVPQVAWSRRRPRRRREEAYSIDTATAERSENRLP